MRFWTLQAGIALAAIVGLATLGAPACGSSTTSTGSGGSGGAWLGDGGGGICNITHTPQEDECGRTCDVCVGSCDPHLGDPCDAGP